jgi:hypothetical protein
MSLINDALRRAKEAQEQAPVPRSPHLPFRPVEPAQQSARRGLGLLLPAALAAVALLALLVVWQWTRMRGAAIPTEVNARTAHVPQAATPASALAAQPAPVQAPASPPSPLSGAAASVAADAASAPTYEPLAGIQESDATNEPAITAPTPPKPAPLRLQAIIFNPRRPSAMISGKTLFIGDKLGDLRVVAISKESAILAGAGQTNVLTLSE